LRALIDRVSHLDNERPWIGNTEIIRDLRRALAGFEARALIRKAEKGLRIEAISIASDGHLALLDPHIAA
jgi:hypothetical protein